LVKHTLPGTCKSLPFDNGFFPPASVASVLKSGNMNLVLNNNEPGNFHFCKKVIDGAHFVSMPEQQIETELQLKGGYDNELLDSTCGYYTHNIDHGYVLAHYIWHESAGRYVTNYRNTIDDISSMFQRRLERLYEICSSHGNRFYIYYSPQQYKTLKIDNDIYDLTDMETIKDQLDKSFPTGENIILCFSNIIRKNKNNIFYLPAADYIKFCKHAEYRNKKN